MCYLDILRACPLFANISDEDIETMLSCLGSTQKELQRNDTLYAAGEEAFQMGILLRGAVDIVQEDFWGNQVILARLEPGDIFAESFVLAQVQALPVSIIARQDSAVLLLDYRRMMPVCANACAFHERLISNLMTILARKNLQLTQKIEHVTKRTTREKLLAFLSTQAKKTGSNSFTIPYNRQALADYLGVDRSAMSTELARMQQEGLLTYERSRFVLAGEHG